MQFLIAGQLLKYVIVDYERRKANLLKLINNKTIYDIDIQNSNRDI
jgi:hypothetical protein